RLPKRQLTGRLLNLGSYYGLAALGALRLPRPDVVVAETDPPLLGVLGAVLKARWGCRFVYYCQDIYPEVAEITGGVRSRALLRLLARGNRFAYRQADRIIVLGDDMRQRLLQKGVDARTIAVLPNWVDCDIIRPIVSNPFRAQFGDRFVVMYSGNLGLSQQLDTVLDAADQLRDDPRIVFVFIGEGARKAALQERGQQADLSNVRFFPYAPKTKLAESLGAADLHLIPLQAGLGGYLVPSKVHGVLAAGRPFIAMMDEDAAVAVLARAYRVGFVRPPGDAAALAQVVRDALLRPAELKSMGLRARALAEQQFHRPILTQRFSEIMAAVTRR
ncbi:MAG: glycosyltransferase family 4 protein, partial [Candidatus Binatia bacterium]